MLLECVINQLFWRNWIGLECTNNNTKVKKLWDCCIFKKIYCRFESSGRLSVTVLALAVLQLLIKTVNCTTYSQHSTDAVRGTVTTRYSTHRPQSKKLCYQFLCVPSIYGLSRSRSESHSSEELLFSDFKPLRYPYGLLKYHRVTDRPCSDTKEHYLNLFY